MTPRGIIFSDEDRAKLAAFDSGNEIRPGRILAEIDTDHRSRHHGRALHARSG